MNQQIQAPDYLSGDRRRVGVQSMEGMGVPPLPYISIEAQKFTLVDAAGATYEPPTYGAIFTQGGQPVQGSPLGIYLDAILVDANEKMSKVYYERDFTPGQAMFTPPDCWSDNGVAPSVGARSPQHPTCSLCPKAEWG